MLLVLTSPSLFERASRVISVADLKVEGRVRPSGAAPNPVCVRCLEGKDAPPHAKVVRRREKSYADGPFF